MKFRLKELTVAPVFMSFVGLVGFTLAFSTPVQCQSAAQQAAAATGKGLTAGEYFKNVTTSTLKGLTPSDFLGAMGVMTAAVGYDCSNCHPGAGTDAMDWVTDSNPKKVTARKMVEMVATINRQSFSGAQMVTCWTCHHGLDLPTTSIALDKLYGEPNDEKRDVVVAAEGEPPATQILDFNISRRWAAPKSSMPSRATPRRDTVRVTVVWEATQPLKSLPSRPIATACGSIFRSTRTAESAPGLSTERPVGSASRAGSCRSMN